MKQITSEKQLWTGRFEAVIEKDGKVFGITADEMYIDNQLEQSNIKVTKP